MLSEKSLQFVHSALDCSSEIRRFLRGSIRFFCVDLFETNYTCQKRIPALR
jgi:hypothetical protein